MSRPQTGRKYPIHSKNHPMSSERRERELSLLGAAMNLAEDAERGCTRYPVNSDGYQTLHRIAVEAARIATAADRGNFAATGIPYLGIDFAEKRLRQLRDRFETWNLLP